jgi:hypothetical protein
MRKGFGSYRASAVVLAAAAVFMSISAASARPVSIVNGTRTAMVALQIRPSDAPVWRPDILNHRPLGIQKQVDFEVGPACFFDVKAMFEDGHRVNKQHVNLCKSTTYLLTDF